MERKNIEESLHSVKRAKERIGLSCRKAEKLIELARTRGIRSDECRWSVDRNFLESKTNKDAIAVAYNGFCFIFDRDTYRCITLFRLPKCFGKKKTYYKTPYRKYQRCLKKDGYIEALC